MSIRVYLVCPVRNATPEQTAEIKAYVEGLEANGYLVHWPARDTIQEDETNGWQVCEQNGEAIMGADEVHVWWDPKSQGSMFDLGMAWMLRLIEEWSGTSWSCDQKFVLANKVEIPEGKAFEKVLMRWAGKAKGE